MYTREEMERDYSTLQKEQHEAFMKFAKTAIGFAVCALVAIFGIVLIRTFAHKLENQNLAVVQSFSGTVEVRRQAGWWFQPWPTIVQYPKAGMYRLNAEDKDSLEIQFNNKSKALMNAAIGYRIDGSTDDVIINLHQQVEGDDEKIWQMVLTALNTESQSITTKYDPSSVIGGDKFETMVQEIYTAIIHNKSLLEHGIDVNYFAVDGRPIPDKETEEQFAKQKEADLAKRLAEAEKLKLEAETIRTQAEYAKHIAEQKGQAEAQMAKDVQSAEREKKLAEIEAEKRVAVEKLNKEQILIQMAKEKEAAEIEIQKQKAVAIVEADKLREVAEIQKKTEAANLEAIKLRAEQEIEKAKAKKQSIELSGAITEVQKAQIELERQIAQYKWEGIAKGLAGMKLPAMLTIGGASGKDGKQNSLDKLIEVMTLEKLKPELTQVK